MTAQLIPLATYRAGQWIDLDGEAYSAPALPAGASFVCSTDCGEPALSMLIPGADFGANPSFECTLYETRCQECGQYMQARPPAGWTPKPVYVRCDECIAKDSEELDNTQKLIKDFSKMMRRG